MATEEIDQLTLQFLSALSAVYYGLPSVAARKHGFVVGDDVGGDFRYLGWFLYEDVLPFCIKKMLGLIEHKLRSHA